MLKILLKKVEALKIKLYLQAIRVESNLKFFPNQNILLHNIIQSVGYSINLISKFLIYVRYCRA